jgi:hypothetical protein
MAPFYVGVDRSLPSLENLMSKSILFGILQNIHLRRIWPRTEKKEAHLSQPRSTLSNG